MVLTPNTAASISTTYTTGTSTTETESFGNTISVSGGVEIGALSASVSETLSETYSTSVTITESTSDTFERSVRGVEGKTTRFMIWSLVERYSFTDADGAPISDASYELVPDELYRHGVATALQAVEFPL
jgi:hypothetical protein